MARAFTSPERALIALGMSRHDVYPKFELEDPDGNWVNIIAFTPSSWVMNLVLEENIDANCQTFSGTLIRDLSVTNSLAPLMTGSTKNRDSLSAYAPFLDVGRKWRAKVAIVAKGAAAPAAGDYKPIGEGYYDILSVGGDALRGGSIQITGRDLGAKLLDVQIDTPTVYSPDSDEAMEDVLQTMIDDVLGAGVLTLYVPTSPSFVMNKWEQEPMSLMQALNDVAKLAGMVVKYRYDASDVFRLTLYVPDRTASSGDEVWSLGQDEYWQLPQVTLDKSGIRTKVVVNYWDSATNAGATVTAENTTARDRYCDGVHNTLTIDLAKNKNIDNAVSAQAFCDMVLLDVSAPALEQEVLTHAFWIAQLGDYGKFTANTTAYDTDQYGGVTRIRHEFTSGALATMRTTLGIRGQPAGRYRTWIAKDRPLTPYEPCTIENFREKTRASTTITAQWANVGNAEGPALEIALYYVISALPVAADPWPSLTGVPTVRLTAATTEYDFSIPDQNTMLHGILVPIGPRGKMGTPWRFTLQPTTQARLIQRAKVQSSSATQVIVRVEVANPVPGADVSIAYVSGLSVSPVSPQTVLAASVPVDLANSGALTNYVDFTVTRPSFQAGTGRVTFTATSTDRISDQDAVDVPAQERDTAALVVRVDSVSSSDTQIVVRVKVAAPNAVATVTVAYDNGGLTVAPASGGTLTPTSSLATTGYIDYTIDRSANGSPPVRVSFTASGTGYTNATDGVDVYPNSFQARAKVTSGSGDSVPNNTITYLTFDTLNFDNGFSFSAGDKLVCPRAGRAQIAGTARFDTSTLGSSALFVQILAGGSIIGEALLNQAGGGADTIINVADIAQVAASDEIKMRVVQNGGANMNVVGTLSAHYLAT